MNFRNYERMEININPGMLFIQGANGEGKSNLLEALYLLAITKSYRAKNDRELVRLGSIAPYSFTQISAIVQKNESQSDIKISLSSNQDEVEFGRSNSTKTSSTIINHSDPKYSVKKSVSINGIIQPISKLIGEVNAVIFSAQDLNIVYGSPIVRRRFIDILISQIDSKYLSSLQKYQQIISQRNHLLKDLRRSGSGSKSDRIEFWNEELVKTGSYIMACRSETIKKISRTSNQIHTDLTSEPESINLIYRPSIKTNLDAPLNQLTEAVKKEIESNYQSDISQGFTAYGPHRDDLQIMIKNIDAGKYASRGQCRTIVLSMKLAEANYLMDYSKQEPILLLDDILSELDSTRRNKILKKATEYQQCFITSTDLDSKHQNTDGNLTLLKLENGNLKPI